MTKIPKHIYRTARAMLFAAILAVAALYLIIYVLVSMPALQKKLVAIAEDQLSSFLKTEVAIGRLEIYPFNEVRVSDLVIYNQKAPGTRTTPSPCLSVDHIGAGIDLIELFKGKIVITYAEVTGLDTKITKESSESPLNIAFIFDAFKPKEKKESDNVELRIHTVVIRMLSASYDNLWVRRKPKGFDPSHFKVTNFRADISIPRIDTKPFAIDTRIRRIAFVVDNKLEVTDLSFTGTLDDRNAKLQNFLLRLPSSTITLSDIELTYDSLAHLPDVVDSPHLYGLHADLTPADLALFVPGFQDLKSVWNLGVVARADRYRLTDLSLGIVNQDLGFELRAEGEINSFLKPKEVTGLIDITKISVMPEASSVFKRYIPSLKGDVERIVEAIGNPSLDMKGSLSRRGIDSPWTISAEGSLATAAGSLEIEADGTLSAAGNLSARGAISSDRLELGTLLGTAAVSEGSFSIDFDVEVNGKLIEGELTAEVPHLVTSSGAIENLSVNLRKTGNEVYLTSMADSRALGMDLEGALSLDGPQTSLLLSAAIERLPASLVGLKGKFDGAIFSGRLNMETSGDRADNLSGTFTATGLGMTLPDNRKLEVDNLIVDSSIELDGTRKLMLKSDLCDLNSDGRFLFSTLAKNVRNMFASLLPAVNPLAKGHSRLEGYTSDGNINLHLTVHPLDQFADFFNFPVRPLVDTDIHFAADFNEGSSILEINAPYIRQGKSKLFANSVISSRMSAPGILDLSVSTQTPTKSSILRADLNIGVKGDAANITADFNPDREAAFKGRFALDAKAVNILSPEILLNLRSSTITINDGKWNVEDGNVMFKDKRLAVDNIRIVHGDQFVKIDGSASSDPNDILTVNLADIDLSYIFDVLNITYVNFGGFATGRVRASELFTKTPKASTEDLVAREFSYGGAKLGDADLRGVFHAGEKRIEIGAKIADSVLGRRRADVDGNIWLGRDSLSFNFDADHLNASFLGQFMTAFASDLTATASGKCHLFGTFKDIDLRGKVHADSLRFKLDFTGVYYGGSDSVTLAPGKIEIPSFRIYDRDGNSGVFSGELRHTFLRDVFFDFKLRDASHMLVYDLPKGPDDFWWGTVYGSGNGTIRGVPGLTNIDIDMRSESGSSFWFELSEKEAARDYNFLTFTDKTPKPDMPKRNDTPDFIEMFRKKRKLEEAPPSDVHIDLRMNVTPAVLLTLIMDPVSGDKITGRGSGPLQLQYETENDEPRIYGKYTIAEGLYNFSLQDVILRDFQIRDGSSITFNGDPLAAILDIRAAYRVNTSLTDLDKSFAYDRDLNRTNVPVDAMLLVSGPLDTPDIDFDLELPTLTEDVARKVRSIVSTNDLMSRQIIYLLALNRFYTPEYMDTSASGSEWTSVASSTISSQLGNALSQLTDKLSVMPSIRSDKGDFSDLEMDVALSSRLLNNRLLINGNFGYRDRTTSTTTFVGDFDVQYLLDRKGNFRLKAYNHFNDQNYYLRQSLTTQGLGLEYRHDFNRFLSFLRPGRRRETSDRVIKNTIRDSVSPPVLPLGHASGAGSVEIKDK